MLKNASPRCFVTRARLQPGRKQAKKEAEDALANRTDALEISEAQAKLAEAMAQLQALERLRKNLKH